MERPFLLVALTCVLATPSCGRDPDDPSDSASHPDTSTDTSPDTAHTGETGEVDDGSAPVSNVQVTVHPDVSTLLVVSWAQVEDAESAWVEYTFEDAMWESSPPVTAPTGPQQVVLLGIPADTPVTLTLVEEVGGRRRVAEGTFTGTTGPLPEGLPVPTLLSWDPAISSPAPWLFLTVDTGLHPYQGPWWATILDRQGRVVWYRALPEERPTVMSRVSADGTHLTWAEMGWYGDDPSRLVRTTLDGGWGTTTELPEALYTYDELPDGTIAYDAVVDGSYALRTLAPDGTVTDVWSCSTWLPDDLRPAQCGTNTVRWNAERGTYLWSMYDLNTVLELDPTSGTTLAAWGDHGTDPLLPEDVSLQMQHYPGWTTAGTLLLHTQENGPRRVEWAREFAWDEATNGLTQIWSYSTSDWYAECSGEAVRLENGNTLLNYGCGGGIREITSDGQVAWDVDAHGLVGHQTQVGDLYAVNQGQKRPDPVRPVTDRRATPPATRPPPPAPAGP